MNDKFVRVFEEVLLRRLIKDHNQYLNEADYVLGIPRNNLNPLTRLKGNTYIELHPRNATPNGGSIVTYYNREDLGFCLKNIEVKGKITVFEELDLYSLLGQINEFYQLNLSKEDVYNTSLKEFPDGKIYAVLLAHPESLRYTGTVEIEINVDSRNKTPASLMLSYTIIDLTTPSSIKLTASVKDIL